MQQLDVALCCTHHHRTRRTHSERLARHGTEGVGCRRGPSRNTSRFSSLPGGPWGSRRSGHGSEL